MSKDKKIKAAIDELTKPEIPFEEFCARHNIVLEPKKKEQKPQFALWKKLSIATSAVAVVALAIVLPVTLTNRSNASTGEKTYGVNDVNSVKLLDSDINDVDWLNLNLSNMMTYGNIQATHPKNNVNKLLAYSIDNVVYATIQGDDVYAYQFDYTSRCYDKYNFFNNQLYTDEQGYTYKDVNYGYTISESGIAYISYEIGKYDYFIELTDFEDMTTIDSESTELFIRCLADGVPSITE